MQKKPIVIAVTAALLTMAASHTLQHPDVLAAHQHYEIEVERPAGALREPRAPMAVSNDVTVKLTGQQVSVLHGTLVPGTSVPLVGQHI